MKKYLLKSFILFIFTTSLSAQTFEELDVKLYNVVSSQNDTIYFIKANTDTVKPKPTILFCQGSLPIPLIIKDSNDMFVPSINNFDYKKFTDKYNFIVISAPNIPPIPSSENLNSQFQYIPNPKYPNNFDTCYLHNDYLENYVRRASIILSFLRRQKWVDKNKIVVVGHSQGSYVAFKISEKDKNIKALGYFSGNPAGRFTQYIRQARRLHNTKENTAENMQANINELYNTWHNMLSGNVKDKELEKTILAWTSFTLPLWNELIELKTPIFVAYGTEDLGAAETSELLPIYFDKYGKSNYKIYPLVGCGHNFEQINKDGSHNFDEMHWYDVMKTFTEWLETAVF